MEIIMSSKCWKCGSCQECKQKAECTCIEDAKKYQDNIVTFGKYKGMTFKDLREMDPAYLVWAYSAIPKHKFDQNLYHYIRTNSDEITEESIKQKRKTGWVE
jgi:uncharacterized protein (DUF3820 family)